MPKPAIIRLDANAKMEQWPNFPESEVSSGDRSSHGHRWFEDKALGFSIGIWEADANLGRWMKWPVHEFMILLEGEVVMIEDDRETVIKAGESFFISKGRRCVWNQAGYVKKFMVLFDDPAGDHKQPIFKIDPMVKAKPSTPPSANILHSPVPTQNTHEYFENATGEFTVGVWDTTGYHRKLIDFPRHELMHLLEGSVTFTDDKSGTQTFLAGDTFFVPLGTPNSWKSEGYLRKIYCIFQPKTGT
ncbi:MAG TPA: cupin domain-containing protein [Aestuariivirga sp.]